VAAHGNASVARPERPANCAEQIAVATIETDVRALATACIRWTLFQHMLWTRDANAQSSWISSTEHLLRAACFGRAIKADFAAARAALSEPWSNGQPEGQIAKLKLVKRLNLGAGRLLSGGHSASGPELNRSAFFQGPR
jgi:hypothetical protein